MSLVVGAFVACGSSIRANGLFRKLLIGDALGAGPPHWTISATGSSAKLHKQAHFRESAVPVPAHPDACPPEAQCLDER